MTDDNEQFLAGALNEPRANWSLRQENEGEQAPPQPMGNQAGSLIKEFGTPSLPEMNNSRIHCINVIGQVEGHMLMPPQNKATKYEHLIPQLVAIEQDERIEGVLVILNTVGGDVESGLAIAEAISGLSKPSVSLVIGGGHSIGVPIAVSADYSFIATSATMTIHPVRLTGMVIGVPATMEYLERMQDRVVAFVTEHSQITDKKFRQLMFTIGELSQDIGTVVVGHRAVEYGLINEVGSIKAALAKLDQLIDEQKGACSQ